MTRLYIRYYTWAARQTSVCANELQWGPTRPHQAPPSPQLRFARWEMGLSVCSSSSACLCKSTQRLFKEIRAKLKLHMFWPTRRAMEIGHCLIYVNGAIFCFFFCCITFTDRRRTSTLTQVTSFAGRASWVRLSEVNVLTLHLLRDSSIWLEWCVDNLAKISFSYGPGLSYFSVDRCISQWQMCNVESRKGWDIIVKMCLSDMLGTLDTCGLTNLDSYVFTL